MITVAPPPAPKAGAQNDNGTGGPPVFSNVQAMRGKLAYDSSCATCHGSELNNGEFGGPPLVGLSFKKDFGGGGVDNLFSFMTSQMPADKPGSLTPQTYADITAYILQANGYQAGNADLPSNTGALGKMILDQ